MGKQTLLLLLLTPFSSFAQQGHEKAVVESATGAYLIFTNDSNSLIFHLDTAKVEPVGNGDNFFVLVDNTLTLQLFTIDFQNPNNKDIDDLEVQKSFLIQYMNYELNYFNEELQMNIENQKAGFGPVGDKHFLLWHFDTPDLPAVQKQLYLSTIVFDNFLNINIPLTNNQTFEDGLNFLDRVARTLELHDHPINIEEFYKKVNGL